MGAHRSPLFWGAETLIYRNQIRTIKNTTETTRETLSVNAATLGFNLTTSDAFYIGYHKPFCSRYFNLSTVNTNGSSLVVTFWNGSDWVAVEDQIDQTMGCTQSGFLAWQNPGTWRPLELSPVTDVKLYWLRIVPSANFSAGTALQSINNLFCDATMVRAYYPELISDTRYLPSGRTDFIEQFEAAKDLVVRRLKQLKAIEEESQILDVNEVAIAATHAAAYLILAPLAKGETEKEAEVARIHRAMEDEITHTLQSFDLNDSGIIGPEEAYRPPTFKARW